MSRQRRAFESVLLATLVVLVLVAVGLGVFGEWRDIDRAADARTADDVRQTALLNRLDDVVTDLEALQLAELTGDVTALEREVAEIRARTRQQRREERSEPSDDPSDEQPPPTLDEPDEEPQPQPRRRPAPQRTSRPRPQPSPTKPAPPPDEPVVGCVPIIDVCI